MPKKTRMTTYVPLLFVFLVLGWQPNWALDATKQITQYSIEQWTEEKGLPQNSVFTVLQTRDGYLWLGTEEGLARFDGVVFKVFDPSNTPAMTRPSIHSLYEDSHNNLWIGTVGGGALCYHNGTFTSYAEKEGLPGLIVTSFLEDRAGNIWIGTIGGVLCRKEAKNSHFTVFTTQNGLPGNDIKNLYQDSRGAIWIATAKGLSCFQNNRLVNYPLSTTGDEVTAVYEDKQKNLWVGTMGALFLKQGHEFVQQTIPQAEKGIDIRAITQDHDGNLWIATRNLGLLRYSHGQFTSLGNQNGLNDNWILSIFEDREGCLWVGSSSNGLYRLKDDKFIVLTAHEGLPDDIIWSVYEDSSGYVWIGTNNGLCRFKNGQMMNFTTKEGLIYNTVDTITQDNTGNLWVGTDKGLSKLKNTETGIVKLQNYLEEQFISAIVQDRSEQILVATLDHVYQITENGAEAFATLNTLAESLIINLLHVDRQGKLWFGSMRGGIGYVQDGKIIRYTTQQGLATDGVTCVYEDNNGVLWWGSNNGLNRVANGHITTFNKRDGLFNNNIYRILEDGSGNFWMSSNKGIFRVKKAELDALATGKKGTVTSIPYGKEDGMRSPECNGGYLGAGCKTRDGRLWFPTMKGVAIIAPDHLKTNKIEPPVHIETVFLNDVAADLQKPIVLSSKTKRLEFHYTALTFFSLKNVRFKYRLEGYDENWVDADSQRTAGYTNLDGGTYQFRVIACNNDGLWNLKGAAITIKVIPPFWKTWWFILLALIVFAFLSYAVIHLSRKYISMAQFWKKQKYIGKFKLVDTIGSGGMGTVYKANNLMDKKETVALKVLREDLFNDENNRKRFKQEAAIIDQLDHPNIIKIYERGQAGQNLFIAMELLEGKTLAQKITEVKKLELGEALHIMVQVADALAKIHSKSIIHRDLKPENIMLIERGQDANFVKLLDFGLAKMQHQTRLTQTGIVIGTISYMSPEQISGKGSAPASDVYALGIIFYEMITGVKPFIGETTIDIMKQILDKMPIEPIRFRFDISFELNRLIMWMLEKEQAARPHIQQVLKQLHITCDDLKSLGNTTDL